jgi:DNA transformation protein and related proteins
MGSKGATSGEQGRQAAQALAADLQPLGEVTTKRMFGGSGVFLEGTMFALVDPQGRCFLRADDATSGAFDAAGSQRHGKMPYRGNPTAVRDDPDELVRWARAAADVALAAKR